VNINFIFKLWINTYIHRLNLLPKKLLS